MTSQVKDLNAKLSDAQGKIADSLSELRLKAAPVTAKDEGEGSKKDEFAGVEMEPSVLTGPVKDR